MMLLISLLSVGIIGIHHHTPLLKNISKVYSFSFHKSASKYPDILKVNVALNSVMSLCYLFNFILDVFLAGAFHVDIVAVGTGIVAGNCLAESLSSVPTRSMDEQRMKENSVSLLHHQVHPVAVLFVVLDAVIHFVNPSLPVGVTMWLQSAFVGTWEHNQTTVVSVNVLHGGPSTNNAIAGAEREVVQILMQGVPRCLLARI